MSLSTAINVVVGVQALTFFVLFPLLLQHGNWRLAAAQFLLGLVTILVYTA